MPNDNAAAAAEDSAVEERPNSSPPPSQQDAVDRMDTGDTADGVQQQDPDIVLQPTDVLPADPAPPTNREAATPEETP